MMMMDTNQDSNDDDDNDSEQTESYTPPTLDMTNNSSEKENSSPIKQQSIIVLDDSDEPVLPNKQNESVSTSNNYWDQWPLAQEDITDEERLNLYSIPDIDMPPSPPTTQSMTTAAESNILDILTGPSPSFSNTRQTQRSPIKKAPRKRKKKKKPMSEYRPPSPFSPKPDYKSMDIEQLKKHAMKYGLSATQAKSRLIKILDEIYNYTHQYETDTDYEFDTNEIPSPKNLSHTPPTPAIIPDTKKVKKRQAIHQMSSSDDSADPLPLPPPSSEKKLTPPVTTIDHQSDEQSNNDISDDENVDHEGRFLELTVHELSTSTASSSSTSIIHTPTTSLPLNDIHLSDSKKSESSQSSTTKKSKASTNSESDSNSTKKAPKRPKLETPTIPLKELVRTYIESNPQLHSRILCYEPIDFEEFHKQMKTDLNIKIASKELMQCLDDQCITFTLRSRKGAFTSVMRAKRRHK